MSAEGGERGRAAGLKGQVVAALRWSAIAKFGGQLVNWAITFVVIRLLAAADYGLVAMLTLLVAFMAMLGEMGFGLSLTQARRLDETEIRRTLGASIVVNAALCLLLVAIAPGIAAFYDEPRLVDLCRVAALGFLAHGVSPVYLGLLQREMRFRTIARIEIATGLVANGVTLGCALAGLGAWALILGPLVAGPVRLGMLLVTATRRYVPALGLDGVRRLWTFGGNVLVTRVVWYWSSQADVLIAGKFLGKEALGLYSVAVHLASLPMQRTAGMINGVAFAAFARIQHDAKAVAANTRLGVRLMALVMFPTMWGIAAVAPELVDLALGPDWHGSILPLTLVALVVPFRMIGSIVSTTMMSTGRVDVAMWTTIAGACIAPPVFLYASRFGIDGLAFAWIVTAPILFALNMVRALPVLGLALADLVTEIRVPLAVGALMFCAVSGLRTLLAGQPGLVVLTQLVAGGAAVYCGGSWLLNRTASLEALSLVFPKRFAHPGAAAAR